MMKSINQRTRVGLFMHLVLAGIGVVWVVLSFHVFFNLEIKLPAVFAFMMGVFLIVYSLKQFQRVRSAVHRRELASEQGIVVPCTVVEKKISSLGRQSYWSLSAKGQLSEKEIQFTDKCLFKDIVDRYEIGSTVNVKVVTDDLAAFEFQLDEAAS